MPKISQLPPDTESPISATDYVAGVQAGIPGTVRFLLSSLATFFWTLANIPSGATSPITRDSESQVNFVKSGGMVWSGNSYGSNLLASMTAGVVYVNGRRISINSVTSRAFTASDDTYIDVLDNGDGTGTLVYSTVTNNSAAPALAANSIRIARINAGATSIAAASSVIQYGLDSIGNFIYNISSTAAPITIYTNPGSAGGTFYYKNQSGVKEFWGQTVNTIGSTNAGTNGVVTMPSNFFNQVLAAEVTIGPNNTTNQQSISFGGGGVTPTLLQINVWAALTTSAEQCQVYVRGF